MAYRRRPMKYLLSHKQYLRSHPSYTTKGHLIPLGTLSPKKKVKYFTFWICPNFVLFHLIPNWDIQEKVKYFTFFSCPKVSQSGGIRRVLGQKVKYFTFLCFFLCCYQKNVVGSILKVSLVQSLSWNGQRWRLKKKCGPKSVWWSVGD